MKVEINRHFVKDTTKLTTDLRERIFNLIEMLEKCTHLEQIPSIKKLKGYKNAYRIRIGDYRIGLYLIENAIELRRVLHRKEMYDYFPD